MNDDRIISVPIHTVMPHPRNEEFYDNADPESFQRLKESIAEVGMLTPIRISKNYTIISGHQRYRACKELGVEFIQVIIDGELEDEDEMLMQLIVSNFGRMKNDPVKQGALIEEYERLCGISRGRPNEKTGNNSRIKSQEELAKEFGCDVTTLRNLKRLSKLPPEVQEIIRSGKLSPTTAVKVIAPLPLEDQLKLIQALPEASKRLTQAAVQAEVTKLRDAAIEAEREKEAAEEANTRAAEIVAEVEMSKEAMRDELSYAKEVADSLRAQLTDAHAQLAQQPREVAVFPADYETLKAEACKVQSLQSDNDALQSAVRELQGRLEARLGKDYDTAGAEAPVWTAADEYMEQFSKAFTPLRSFVKGVIDDLSVVDTFSADFKANIVRVFPKIAADLVTISEYCATLKKQSVPQAPPGIQF